jgi:malonyl CoA-acyl carrier protein transacylase
LLEALFPEPSTKRSESDAIAADMAYAQAAQFAVQYALAELWRSWGVEPTLVAGHSLGEYAAACVAGVFSLEDGLNLVAARGRLLQSLPSAGAMAAVFAEEARVASAMRPYNGAVAIAAVNGPQSVVVSGQADAVRGVIADLGLTPEQWRRLDVPAASHSPLVEPVLDAFERVAADVAYQAPRIGLVSTLTGQLATGADLTTPGYWRRHLRQPVRFAQAIETLHAQGIDVFVEIGPHPTLLGMGRRCLGDDVGTWLPSLRHDWDDWEQISESVAHLYVRGVPVDWAGFDRDYPRRRVALPTYPFERQRYWAEPARRPAPAPPTLAWERAVAAARRQADQGPLALNLASYPEKWTCLNRLASAYVVRALRQLGVYGRPGEVHTPAELVAAHGVNSGYEKLLLRWLEGLVGTGLLERQPDEAFVCRAPLADPDLPALERAAETILADVTPLLEYVRRCGEKLAAILTGAESPLETLFPEGSYATVEYLYRDWPVARYENALAAAVVEAWTHTEGRSLQMLEIGGGTGGTTHSLLPVLPAERTTYWFTDVSDFFLGRAQEQFRAYPFVRYGLLDVERDPSAQGYQPHCFDVVVAANVLHATRDLDATLEYVRWLLAPGGVLVLYEATTHPHWFDVTTALIEGWQRFADEWRSDNPLLGADQWARALGAHGFEAVCAFPDADSPPAVLGQHIIVARGPASVSNPTELTPALRDEAVHAVTRNEPLADVNGYAAPVVESTAAEEFVARLRAALPDERQELVVAYVRSHVARVLRLADAGTIDPHHRLLDLGLDSLMAVDLRDRLSRGLALPRKLPATLIFDYPTVAVIASYLERQVMDAQPSVPAAEVATTMPGGQATTPPTTQEAIADLSDEEVARLLMQKLERQ